MSQESTAGKEEEEEEGKKEEFEEEIVPATEAHHPSAGQRIQGKAAAGNHPAHNSV